MVSKEGLCDKPDQQQNNQQTNIRGNLLWQERKRQTI